MSQLECSAAHELALGTVIRREPNGIVWVDGPVVTLYPGTPVVVHFPWRDDQWLVDRSPGEPPRYACFIRHYGSDSPLGWVLLTRTAIQSTFSISPAIMDVLQLEG